MRIEDDGTSVLMHDERGKHMIVRPKAGRAEVQRAIDELLLYWKNACTFQCRRFLSYAEIIPLHAVLYIEGSADLACRKRGIPTGFYRIFS